MGVGTNPVFAQNVPPGAEESNAAEESNCNDIVVTATRRAVSIQDVPINISAVGQEQLSRQRIDDVRDIADFHARHDHF